MYNVTLNAPNIGVGRGNIHSVKTLGFSVSSETSRHCVLKGGAKCRTLPNTRASKREYSFHPLEIEYETIALLSNTHTRGI